MRVMTHHHYYVTSSAEWCIMPVVVMHEGILQGLCSYNDCWITVRRIGVDKSIVYIALLLQRQVQY